MTMTMSSRAAVLAGAVALLSQAPAAHADTETFDGQMKPLVQQYAKIHTALAGDKTKGVDRAAGRISKLSARLDPSTVTGKHAGHYRHLPQKIKAGADKLRKAKGIKAKREAFKELSKPFAMWATMSKPDGINVLFCSMARGSWLQGQGEKIRNPYYGAKMLRCGEVVSGTGKGQAGGHMQHKGQMQHKGHMH